MFLGPENHHCFNIDNYYINDNDLKKALKTLQNHAFLYSWPWKKDEIENITIEGVGIVDNLFYLWINRKISYIEDDDKKAWAMLLITYFYTTMLLDMIS